MPEEHREGGVCGCVVLILALNILFGGICTQYTVNFWGSKIKKEPIHAPFVPCAIAGLFLGEFTVPIAAATLIIDKTHIL